jgi:phage terminase large subunit GpA-like protein
MRSQEMDYRRRETQALRAIETMARKIARPPPSLSISQWAAENLILSAEDSAEPGRYQPHRAPYQAGILDAVNAPGSDGVVVMSSAQVGKTLIAKAIMGYFIDQDPSPILFVTYSLDMAETFSKDRLAPMVRDTTCLRDKIADPRARDSGNTILHKRFRGGHLTMVGANAPGGLASRPVRVVLLDEVDRYPASAGTEGDPVSLAVVRAKTFWNRRIVMLSTPGDEDTSRINPAWLASDMRRYHVACPHCAASQTLRWENVRWVDGIADTAEYACEGCGSLWSDGERIDSLRGGRWIAEFPGRRVAGFHLNEIYSPFRRLSEIVADFLSSKRAPETLKAWVNTSLGEVWRDQQGEKVDAELLDARREPYAEAPTGVVLVGMQVDVQDDRLECEFVGWGVGEESWGLEYLVLRGNPGEPELWSRLSDHLGRTFRREDGAMLTVAGCAIDSAGHYTKQVYEWARKYRGRVYPIVGRSGKGRPLITTSKAPLKQHGIRLHIVGTDTAKELLLFSRLQIKAPGPGYCHFPAVYPADYFKQLTSEKRVVAYSHGRPAHTWVLKKGDRNEALDLRVYGLALLALLRPNLEALAARMRPDAKPVQIRRAPRVVQSNYLGR